MPERPNMDYQSSYAEPPTSKTPLSPLAILINSMNTKYGLGDLDGAVAIARIAAPYLHPRALAAAPSAEFSGLLDAELDALNSQH